MQLNSIFCSYRSPPIPKPVNNSSPIPSSTRSPQIAFPRNRWRINRSFLLQNSARKCYVPDLAFCRLRGLVSAASGAAEFESDVNVVPGEVELVSSGGKSDSFDSPSEEDLILQDGAGSVSWVLGPIVLISSLLLPQFFLYNVVDGLIANFTFAEIIVSICSEFIFYMGLSFFLLVTERLQRPYLRFTEKPWSLITDHRSYLYSSYLTMGIKVFTPLLAAYIVWPVIGLPAVVAIAPFLLGLAVQFVFEERLYQCKSPVWPLLGVIFEVYRLYQLNKGAHFVQRVMISMRGSADGRVLLERSSALSSLLIVFQALGIVCLWSLATFLLRLLPSRPVLEKL